MYQFSRSLYRELAPSVVEDRRARDVCNRQQFLSASEAAFDRLAKDPHYFARPARTLFNDVRNLFPLGSQLRVYRVIERYMEIAAAYVRQQAEAGMTCDGTPLACHATTRKGTPCQRIPLPASKYCPSHKHLDDSLDPADFDELEEASLTATAA